MDDIYFDTTLVEKISMPPQEINQKNIDDYLLQHINNRLGGKCNRNGLIKKNLDWDSITICLLNMLKTLLTCYPNIQKKKAIYQE